MKYQIPTGTRDILPDTSMQWLYIEQRIREVMHRYQYHEIRTPVFEVTELFVRSIGEATDVVGKEMYTFTDKGGDSLTLRPEMTASVMRSYIQHHLGRQQGFTKVYYIGPMFRQERPQKGRLRQFHQFGCELIGSSSPEADADTMMVALTIYYELGLRELNFLINSVGCPACRPVYRQELVKFLEPVSAQLSPDSQKRLRTNPLRILDSKHETDQQLTERAPLMMDFLCDSCSQHFRQVRRLLDDVGIAYRVDGRLVRGLDYYTKTAYEIQSNELGSQNALGGGGRYDGLCEELGGEPTPAVGFAAGMERLLIVMEALQLPLPAPPPPTVYLIALGNEALHRAAVLLYQLRLKGISAEMDYQNRSLKAQMREANKIGVPQVVIIGDEEIRSQKVIIKNMQNGQQTEIPLQSVADYFRASAHTGFSPSASNS